MEMKQFLGKKQKTKNITKQEPDKLYYERNTMRTFTAWE